jgi:hypothetical protein
LSSGPKHEIMNAIFSAVDFALNSYSLSNPLGSTYSCQRFQLVAICSYVYVVVMAYQYARHARTSTDFANISDDCL